MSIIIGMTGPTGAGKSSVLETARKMGVQVLDCDLFARQAVVPGSVGLNALVGVFGPQILNGDQTLNRKMLASLAFSTPENTELLNKTLLPYIVAIVKKAITEEFVLLDAPTLFESGIDKNCDATIAILAEPNLRMERIIARDGLTINQADLRMSAGKPDDYYISRADYVIYNNGNRNDFEAQVAAVLKKLCGGINHE